MSYQLDALSGHVSQVQTRPMHRPRVIGWSSGYRSSTRYELYPVSPASSVYGLSCIRRSDQPPTHIFRPVRQPRRAPRRHSSTISNWSLTVKHRQSALRVASFLTQYSPGLTVFSPSYWLLLSFFKRFSSAIRASFPLSTYPTKSGESR